MCTPSPRIISVKNYQRVDGKVPEFLKRTKQKEFRKLVEEKIESEIKKLK